MKQAYVAPFSWLFWLAAGLSACGLPNAYAQTAPNGPAGAAGVTQPAPPADAKRPPVNTFSILEYRVEGNTLLSTPDVERAVMSHMGENKSLADVEVGPRRARKAVSRSGL